MKQRLEEQLKGLPEDFVVLTILPKENYQDLNMHLVNVMVNQKKYYGAYVSLNWSYHSLIEMMEQRKIDHSKLFFVDCISKKEQDSNHPNSVFLKSAQSLTNIGISLEPIYKSEGHSFVFLDSLDSLALYHQPSMVVRFARSLISKIREHNKSGIMIGLHEETDKKIIDELSVVCDHVIDLT